MIPGATGADVRFRTPCSSAHALAGENGASGGVKGFQRLARALHCGVDGS